MMEGEVTETPEDLVELRESVPSWEDGALGARALAPGAGAAPPGSCCSRRRRRRSRRGGSGAPRGRFPAICGRRGGGGDGTGDSSARRGPEQSNSGGHRAEAPHHRGPRAERLRARPRPGEGREPQRRGAPAGGGAPPTRGPGAGGPRGDTRQRRPRAPELAPVYQAGAPRLTRSGERGGTARGLADTAAPPAASPPPNPAFAGARTAGRPGSSRPGSSRAPASGLQALIKFLATAEVSTPGCQAARRGGPFTC